MNEKKKFWQGKRVLLTGHTGFKGTWMSQLLETLNAIVCGYSLPLSPYSFYSKSNTTVSEHHEGDIADREKLAHVMQSFKPECIIHLASHSSLDGSDKIPDFILKTNIMGVINLLDISRQMDCIKSIVIVTSDKCYKNLESKKPYVEESDLGGIDPYSVSKVCQELITACYQKTFFEQKTDKANSPGIATARASNVIGAGDYNITRLIPYLLDNFINGNPATLRNPNAVRPWQYVLDVIWGYLLLSQRLFEESSISYQYNGPYNFGPYSDGFWTVEDIVQLLSTHFPNARYVFGETKRSVQVETNILKLDSTKAKTLLNWTPLYTVPQIIQETADFIIREKAGVKTESLCKKAIQEYIKKLDEMNLHDRKGYDYKNEM